MRTLNTFNFHSLAEACERQYHSAGGTASGFIRFFYNNRMTGINSASTYAGLSLPNALRRMIGDNMNLRGHPNVEDIVLQEAQAFALDMQKLRV